MERRQVTQSPRKYILLILQKRGKIIKSLSTILTLPAKVRTLHQSFQKGIKNKCHFISSTSEPVRFYLGKLHLPTPQRQTVPQIPLSELSIKRSLGYARAGNALPCVDPLAPTGQKSLKRRKTYETVSNICWGTRMKLPPKSQLCILAHQGWIGPLLFRRYKCNPRF